MARFDGSEVLSSGASGCSKRRNHGPALTFDDGPDPVWTSRILEALREADATATIFVIAPLALRYSRLIEATLEAGHGVEVHCYEHLFDLIVVSEILYYLPREQRLAARGRLEWALAPRGVLLAVYWRKETRTYPLQGDEVHELLAAHTRLKRTETLVEPEHRLGLFEDLPQPAETVSSSDAVRAALSRGPRPRSA